MNKNMIKTKIKNKRKPFRLRTQFALLLIVSILLVVSLFELGWKYREPILYSDLLPTKPTLLLDETFIEKLHTTAAACELPDSEDDTERIQKLKPFFDLADCYTSIYIYDEKGRYLTGSYAAMMDENPGLRTFFDIGYRLTRGQGEDFWKYSEEFQNGRGNILIYNYQHSFLIYSYFFLLLLFCILLFFFIVIFFVNRKIRIIHTLEQEILTMSGGDLTHPIGACGNDELGILAKEMEQLRVILNSNILKEQESRQANQDLITALSHDLRTPLTVLNGYLEVLRLGHVDELKEEYLNRCLKKLRILKS